MFKSVLAITLIIISKRQYSVHSKRDIKWNSALFIDLSNKNVKMRL